MCHNRTLSSELFNSLTLNNLALKQLSILGCPFEEKTSSALIRLHSLEKLHLYLDFDKVYGMCVILVSNGNY